MSKANENKKLEFVKDENYRRMHVTGFWGGITPQNELYIDMYTDILNHPKSVELVKIEEGVFQERNVDQGVPFKRVAQAGVSMPMSVVPSMIRWLQQKVMEYEKEKKRNS